MKTFELLYLTLEPFFPPLYRLAHSRLLEIARSSSGRLEVLDVGGRKSHYTIGVPANITITDLPRESSLQQQLNLGITPEMKRQILERRSNVREVLFDDMTCSSLPDSVFDCIVAVEVLEHVEKDIDFVYHVQRVLKPGGVFLMTTPNGDYIKNKNPDHKRHYKKTELLALLERFFNEVEVLYAVKGGVFHRWGLRSWSIHYPLQTAMSMIGNFTNALESANPQLRFSPSGTHHLIATARK